MAGTKPITLGWKFTYALTDEIDCDNDTHDMPDVEFVTNVNSKQQKIIIGFKITVQLPNQADAERRADHASSRLTWLLVASSGTYSRHHMEGYEELVMSGIRRISKTFSFGFQVRNNAMANIDPGLFHDILNRDTEIAERMQFIANAYMASRTRDYASVIKHLVLACNDEPTGVLERFKYLRHALSHSDGPLRESTVKGLEKFGPGYFTLTDEGKFDFASTSNLHHLEIQAGKFLTHMHDRLREELRQEHDEDTDG